MALRRYSTIPKPSPPGRPSDYFVAIGDALAKIEKDPSEIVVAMYLRVSERNQNYRGTLDTQQAAAFKILTALGVIRIEVFREVGPGWDLTESARFRLLQAVQFADAHDRIVVATNAGRFLRNEYYTPDEIERMPTVKEFSKLREVVAQVSPAVQLATLLDPDMDPREVRGIESKWGQVRTGKKGGRPKKSSIGVIKRRKQLLLPAVAALFESGLSVRAIVRAVNPICRDHAFRPVGKSTISRWIRDITH